MKQYDFGYFLVFYDHLLEDEFQQLFSQGWMKILFDRLRRLSHFLRPFEVIIRVFFFNKLEFLTFNLTFPKSVGVLLRENSSSRFSFFFCFFFSFSL